MSAVVHLHLVLHMSAHLAHGAKRHPQAVALVEQATPGNHEADYSSIV